MLTNGVHQLSAKIVTGRGIDGGDGSTTRNHLLSCMLTIIVSFSARISRCRIQYFIMEDKRKKRKMIQLKKKKILTKNSNSKRPCHGVVQLSRVSFRRPASMWASRLHLSSDDMSGLTYDSRKWHVPGICSGNPVGKHERLLSSNEKPGVFIKSLQKSRKNIGPALVRCIVCWC